MDEGLPRVYGAPMGSVTRSFSGGEQGPNPLIGFVALTIGALLIMLGILLFFLGMISPQDVTAKGGAAIFIGPFPLFFSFERLDAWALLALLILPIIVPLLLLIWLISRQP